MIITIEKEFDGDKLFQELLDAGLVPKTQPDGSSPMQGNTLFVTDDADLAAIQTIIDTQ